MFDLIGLIKAAGYAGLFGIIFAESGLLVGFFLPGDSLLFTAGFLASQGFLNIAALVIVAFLGAVLGDNFGYYFGKRIGPTLFNREKSVFFDREHVTRAQRFYERHGPKAIVLARFIPIVRTFAPILAGVGTMRYPVFLFFNVIGALCWAVGLPFLGYVLGNSVPDIDRYILPIVAAIIILSLAPGALHLLKDPQHWEKFFAFWKRHRP